MGTSKYFSQILGGEKSFFAQDEDLVKELKKEGYTKNLNLKEYNDIKGLFTFKIDSNRILIHALDSLNRIKNNSHPADIDRILIKDIVSLTLMENMTPLQIMNADNKSIEEIIIINPEKIMFTEIGSNTIIGLANSFIDSKYDYRERPIRVEKDLFPLKTKDNFSMNMEEELRTMNFTEAGYFLKCIGYCSMVFDAITSTPSKISHNQINYLLDGKTFTKYYGLNELLERKYTPVLIKKVFKKTKEVLENYHEFLELEREMGGPHTPKEFKEFNSKFKELNMKYFGFQD